MQRWFHCLLLLLLIGNGCRFPPMPVQPQLTSATTASPHRMNLQLLGHIGGAAMTVAFRSSYAFLGFSYEFVVLDLADQRNPRWVTSLPLPTNAITLAGDFAYTVGRKGFAVVDIREPTQPALVSTLALPETPATLAVRADYAYVAAFGDLYIIALTNPVQPRLIGSMQLAVSITGLVTFDNALYVVSNQGFHWLDIAEPAQPHVVALLENNRLRYGPVIADGYLYFGGQTGFWIKDLSSTAAPRLMMPDTALDAILDLAVVDGVAYLASGFQGLHVWDITGPTAVEIGAYPIAGLTKVVVAHAGYVYAINCDEGLRSFDATPPSDLTAVGNFTPLGMTYQLAVNGAFAYIVSGFNNGLHQLAITNPAQMHTVDTHLIDVAVHDLAVVDDALYLILDDGIGVLDLSTPTTPRPVAFYRLPNLWTIAAGGPYLFVSDPAQNLWLLDRTAPTKLTMLATYPTFGTAGRLAIDGKLVYLPASDLGLRILAIGRAGELTTVGFYPRTTEIYKVVVANGYAYLALGKHGLDIVDVSDPTTPRLIRRYDTPGDLRDVAVQWPYLLLADGAGGLRVLDLSAPTRPTEVASYATRDCTYQVLSAAGVIYLVQPLGGIDMFSLTALPAP